MGWVRLSDDFYDHPKFTDVTPLSIALWTVGMAYCNRNLTDGYVPSSVAQRLCDFDGLSYTVFEGELFGVGEDDCAPKAIADLVDAGLWHEDGHDCPDCPQPGYRRYYVHDYLVYQPSAAEVQATKEAKSAAGKKGADSRWHGRSHSSSHGTTDGTSNGKTDGKTMPPTPTPTPLSSNDDKVARAPRSLPNGADRFDEFWNTYGKKVDRQAAYKKWLGALRKPGVTADLLIAAAAAYVLWERTYNENGRYIMGPAKWLLNERWTDEREARPPSTTLPRSPAVQGWLQLADDIAEREGNVSPIRQIGGAS